MTITRCAFGAFDVRVWSGGHGDAVPLVYLHGLEHHPGDAPFLRRLAASRPVHAPELPGYGRSTGFEAFEDIFDLALFHRELLGELGLEQVDLVGHCLGGMVAAEVAATSPQLVRRLVLVDAYGLWLTDAETPDPFSLPEPELRAAKWHDPEHAATEPTIFEADPDDPHLPAITRAQNLSVAAKFLWPIPDRGLRKRLPLVKAPTLVVHGASDGLQPLAHAEELARLVPDATLITIPEAGHLPMVEQEAATCDAILRFLDGA